MYLVADLGNTQLKLALFDQNELQFLEKFSTNNEFNQIKAFLEKLDPNSLCIISSVVESNSETEQLLEKKFKVFYFNTKTKLPIVNKYKTPETLGQDRLANAVAAAYQFPNQDVLVVDMGTCIKYDFITKKGNYLGGAISPGLNMRFESLNSSTRRLPKVKNISTQDLVGKTTEESIISGVVNGISFELNGAIQQYKEDNSSLKIVFTGGDHKRFVGELKYPIFARPNLTLEGLFYILKINENN